MALKEEGNVLLLDEPTNDIDVNTLRALEEGWTFCWLRGGDFARPLVPRPDCYPYFTFEGDSKVYFFEGGYSEYEENRKKRMEILLLTASI
jgi:hypothetical protein